MCKAPFSMKTFWFSLKTNSFSLKTKPGKVIVTNSVFNENFWFSMETNSFSLKMKPGKVIVWTSRGSRVDLPGGLVWTSWES